MSPYFRRPYTYANPDRRHAFALRARARRGNRRLNLRVAGLLAAWAAYRQRWGVNDDEQRKAA